MDGSFVSRRSSQYVRPVMRNYLIAAFGLMIASCGSGDPSPPPSESPRSSSAVSDSQLAKAARDAAAWATPQPLPKGAPEAPTTGFCTTESCEEYRVTFANRDWPDAWNGNYQGQRNVAVCRAMGCDGAVQINLVEACAWRSIIVEMQPEHTDDTDAENLKNDCGKLDAAGRITAERKREALLARLRK